MDGRVEQRPLARRLPALIALPIPRNQNDRRVIQGQVEDKLRFEHVPFLGRYLQDRGGEGVRDELLSDGKIRVDADDAGK